MKNRTIKNISNEQIEIEVIRYFFNNDNEYLIYSLNEIDESGYTKLYASKIIGNKACIITDNDEWSLIKEIIKETVKNNRDGKELALIDLDEDNLSDIILQDTRVFKLQGNLVNLLSENKKVIKKAPVEDITYIPEEEDFIEEEEVDYETLYNDLLTKNSDLEIRVKELEEQLKNYQDMLEKIKEIVE